MKRRDREVLDLQDFTAEDIAMLEAARPAEASKAFDDELPPLQNREAPDEPAADGTWPQGNR